MYLTCSTPNLPKLSKENPSELDNFSAVINSQHNGHLNDLQCFENTVKDNLTHSSKCILLNIYVQRKK